jgi:hypothetical protein
MFDVGWSNGVENSKRGSAIGTGNDGVCMGYKVKAQKQQFLELGHNRKLRQGYFLGRCKNSCSSVDKVSTMYQRANYGRH